jgi:thioesterase domain-containing protein
VSISGYLRYLQTLGIQVTSDSGALRVSAPHGTLTPEIRQELAARKQEILDFLALASKLGTQQSAMVPLQPLGSGPPYFGIAGHNGDVFCYRWLSRALGTERPFFGLQPPGYGTNDAPLADVGQLAEYFAAQIITSGLGKSCTLLGYCAGGTVAFEVARRLLDKGIAVQDLVLIAAPHSSWYSPFSQACVRLRVRLKALSERFANSISKRDLTPLAGMVLARIRPPAERPNDDARLEERRRQVELATLKAVADYTPPRVTGIHGSLVLPGKYVVQTRGSLLRWRKAVPNHCVLQAPPDTSNETMLLEPHAESIAKLLMHRKTEETPRR